MGLKTSLQDLFNNPTKEFEKSFRTLDGSLEQGSKELKEAFSSVAIGKAIKFGLVMLEEFPVYPPKFGLSLGLGMTIIYDKVKDKVSHLKDFVDDPPDSRDSFLDFIFTVAPSTLVIDWRTMLGAFGVESSLAQFGPFAEYSGEQIKEVLEHLLDKAGI